MPARRCCGRRPERAPRTAGRSGSVWRWRRRRCVGKRRPSIPTTAPIASPSSAPTVWSAGACCSASLRRMSSEHDFVRDHTAIASPPLAPEIRLHLATEVTPLWQATEATLQRSQLPPPYWAFAWAGGQALARHLLDHPALVAGRRVLDFGAGSGIVAIAAAKAGARVTAAEPDRFALAALALNAALN